MYHNFTAESSSEMLPVLLTELMNADPVDSRAGETREMTHVGMTITSPLQRELLVPHRKPNIAAQIAETAWVLAGRDDVEWLSHYLPRATQFSDDGKVWRGAYGKRIRAWQRRTPGDVFDQLRWVVDHLRSNPHSRRAVVSIYDPDIDSADGLDIPCNDFLSFSCRNGVLDLLVVVRSNDVIWGWSGINTFEWSVLLEVVAGLVGVKVGSLHFSVTSLHVYQQHWNRSQRILGDRLRVHDKELYTVESPRFDLPYHASVDKLDELLTAWFQIEEQLRHGEKVNLDFFPEPMLRSWLRVIAWWWSGDRAHLKPLVGTRLELAANQLFSVQPPERNADPVEQAAPTPKDQFVEYVTGLHIEKDAAYGDSWCRRGEMLGIMANLARKIDRLGVTGGGDTATDTAIDLLVYLAKYRWWLVDNASAPAPMAMAFLAWTTNPLYSATTGPANELISNLGKTLGPDAFPVSNEKLEEELTSDFTRLEKSVTDAGGNYAPRHEIVTCMLTSAYVLASRLWYQDWDRAVATSNETRRWAGYGN